MADYRWLVENGKDGDALRYRTWTDGLPAWTKDPEEATGYCRRIDAERAHQEDEDAWRFVQHGFDVADEQDAVAIDPPIPGATYRHKRTGGLYTVEGSLPIKLDGKWLETGLTVYISDDTREARTRLTPGFLASFDFVSEL